MADHFGVAKKTVTKHAVKEKWQPRVEELEAKATERSTARMVESLEEMNLRHMKALRAVQGKAIEALRSFSLESAMEAIRALDLAIRQERTIRGEPGERTAVSIEEMVRTLRDPDPSVAAGAATALGMSRNRDLVPHLLAAFGTRDEELGAAIASALGQMEDPRALEALFASLRAGFVPVEVCEALGRIGDPSARPLLLKTLKHPLADVRASAARALSLLERKARKVDAAYREEKLVPALWKLLDDQKPRVRLSAAAVGRGSQKRQRFLIFLRKHVSLTECAFGVWIFLLRTPLQLKSMLMNSAETQIFTNPALLPGGLAPITRIGAGELRVNKALGLKAIAWNPETESAALSFGMVEVPIDGVVLVKRVKVRNFTNSHAMSVFSASMPAVITHGSV